MDIQITSLAAKKVVYLDNVTLPFDDQLVFIRGVNKDSSKINPTGNAVGKTLLFNCLPNVFYGTQPMAVKKNSKKEMLSKGSSIEIKQLVGNDEWRIVQTASSYKFYKNGEDQQIRTAALQKQMLAKLFPLSEVEFYTYCWLSTQKPFPFQAAKDLDRLESLVQMFRLDQYEPLRALAAKRLRSLKDNEIRVSMALSKIQELKSRISKNKRVVSKIDVKASKLALAALDTEKTSISTRLGSLHAELQTLRKLLSIESSLDEYRATYKHATPPAARKAELLKANKRVQAYEKWLHSKSVYDKQLARLTKELSSIDLPKVSMAEAKSRASKYGDQVAELESTVRAAHSLSLQYSRYTKELKPLVSALKGFDPAELPKDLDDQIASARTTVKLKKFLHSHKEGDVCPTCLSDIDLKGIAKLVKSAEAQLEHLSDLEEKASLHKQKLNVMKLRKELDYTPGSYEELKLSYESAAAKHSYYKECLATHESVKALEKRMAAIEEPGEAPSIPEGLECSIDEEIELCDNIISALSAREALGGTVRKASKVKQQIDEAKALMLKLEEKSHSILKEQASHASDIDSYNLAKTLLEESESELESLEAEEKTLSAELPNKLALEALVRAYGSKGIRTQAAAGICSILEQNLNNYRDLVFHEPFIFHVHASDLGLAITVDRGNGFVSDVRSLSGAESNSYRLLFLVSVLSLIPASRRPNFVVLDEPTSHQHIATRQLILERYLPVLKQVIPNIFFVSNVGDHIADSKEVFLIKENGKTRLSDTPISIADKTVKKVQLKRTRSA